jgi:hypothetical protein
MRSPHRPVWRNVSPIKKMEPWSSNIAKERLLLHGSDFWYGRPLRKHMGMAYAWAYH